jgi:hypothetical protein
MGEPGMPMFRLFLFTMTLPAIAQQISTGQLYVAVRPELSATLDGSGSVQVRIRLAPGAQARVWTSAACAAPSPDSYVIARSGIYRIAVDTLPGSGAMVCVASSDGRLSSSTPL